MKSLISTIKRLHFNWRHRNNPIMLRSVPFTGPIPPVEAHND